MAKGLGLKWFVFSDGEQRTLTNFNKALKKAGFKDYKNISEIIVIEQGNNFETHLLSSGYRNELEEVIKHHHLENAKSEQHRQTILNRRSLTVGNLKKILKNGKTCWAPLIAEAFVKLPDESRRFPPKIKELFEIMTQKLNLSPKETNNEQT